MGGRDILPAAAPSAVFTLAGVRHGLRIGLAYAPGITAFGVVFGVLAVQAGLTPWLAALMSTVVYAGTAQMLALNSWATGGLLAVVGAVVAMNARYVLFGAALRPWTRDLPPWAVYLSLFLLVDMNWMEAMRSRNAGGGDFGDFVGIGLTLMVVWVGATAAGAMLGSVVDPRTLGLDFFMIAFFLVLATNLWRGPADIMPTAIAGGTALLIDHIGWGGSSIFLGALAGSLAAAFAPWRPALPAAPPDRR